MKVAHLSSVHSDSDVRIFHKECVSLAQNGHEVYFIVPNSKTREQDGVKILSFEAPAKRFKRMWTTVNKVYKRALELDADVYHIHDPELLRISDKLLKQGKKVIYDVHEDLPRQLLSKDYIPSAIRGRMSKMVEKFENKKAKRMSGIVAATPFIRDRFLKVNPNSIDVNNYPILKELDMSDYPEKTERAICYVGGITKHRGIIELLQALESVDAKLLLAGKFDSEELREKAKSHKSWNKVEELGFLDREGVKNTYKRSQLGMVTLHPIINYVDALPVKMFEYMIAGLPVIASNFPLWVDIVETANAGLCVDPMNPEEIAKAMETILNNPVLAKEMGENGKRVVKEKYNWENEEKKLVSLYTKIGE